MLKWLKQKPTNGHEVVHGTTDDPLATIQVHPITSTKTSFRRTTTTTPSNPNEIYAVSRVNPLFEEEETGKGVLSPEKHSASSGYDSGPSDDESPIGNENSQIQMSPANGPSANNSIVRMPNSSSHLSQLYSGQEDLLIQHEATIVGLDDVISLTPTVSSPQILNVVKQNSLYVDSITVAIKPPPIGRPLSPIAESKSSSTLSKARVNAISIPIRNIDPTAINPGDQIGAAKLIQRNSNYVQSIRIVPSKKSSSSFGKGHRRHSKSACPALLRKPSVTFSENVEIVDGKSNSVPTSRRQSLEHDSIVTESLLMLTSSQNLLDSIYGKRNFRIDSKFFEERKHDELNHIKDNDCQQRDFDDLTSFSNSLSRHPIVKQFVSRNSASLQSNNEEGDEDIIEEELDHHSPYLRVPQTLRRVSTGSKSPFGGIADHYAAAKEIAKEIESYSSGTTKSTRISYVRDFLLSSRGRGGVALTTPLSDSSSSPPPPPLPSEDVYGRRTEVLKMDNQNLTLMKAVVHLNSPLEVKASSSTTMMTRMTRKWESKSDVSKDNNHLWEAVRVEVQPQVYVKVNDKSVRNTSSHLQDDQSGHQDPHDVHITNPQPQLTKSTLKYEHVTMRTHVNVDSHYRQDEGQDQVPIYEAMSPGTTSHLHHHPHEDSDSGISTDRNPKEEHSGDEGRNDIQKPLPGNLVEESTEPMTNSLPNSSINETRTKNSSTNNDKVMIVSGNSQNMVVDLSAVPQDLRDAIISGTAVVTLPDGFEKNLEPVYTMIAIPQDRDYEILPSSPHLQHHPPKNPKEGTEGRDNYATKNLTQVWDVMQHKNKGKRITTVLPYHPNSDSHSTGDFTIEGQPLERQAKRVQRLKTRRCLCRIIGIFIFLIGLMGVIVTLSLVYTKGKHYFGPV